MSVLVLMAADEEDAKGLPDGSGKDAVVKACLSCHGSGSFRKLRLTRDAWADKVADMVDRGAQATDAQAAAIAAYLAENFGKDSRIHINTAPFEELKAVFGLTVREAQSVLAYRRQNGDFHSWRDVQGIAGVDLRKIEEKRDLIVY